MEEFSDEKIILSLTIVSKSSSSKYLFDIDIYINSPGGSVVQGLAIIDCINIIKILNIFC